MAQVVSLLGRLTLFDSRAAATSSAGAVLKPTASQSRRVVTVYMASTTKQEEAARGAACRIALQAPRKLLGVGW
jgi:hypothetical protein